MEKVRYKVEGLSTQDNKWKSVSDEIYTDKNSAIEQRNDLKEWLRKSENKMGWLKFRAVKIIQIKSVVKELSTDKDKENV